MNAQAPRTHRPLLAAAAATLLVLAGCGGGAGSTDATAVASANSGDAPGGGTASSAGPTDAMRASAAATTAASSSNACSLVRPFYWEIGDASGRRAGGSVGGEAGAPAPAAGTPMHFASATKWLYAAYAMERAGGQPTTTDVRMLTMHSGYKNMSGSCDREQTIDGCLAEGINGSYTARADGRYYYNGAHMQVHASLNGLGSMDAAGLGAELRRVLGPELAIDFSSPMPAGGAYGTADAYAAFLRKLLRKDLHLGEQLGAHAVCASLAGCLAGTVMYSPAIPGERAHYALGHWVESDPVTGDGSFHSAGAFGFYPWIDASRRTYGVLARQASNGAHGSMRCGRLIRRAWSLGQPL